MTCISAAGAVAVRATMKENEARRASAARAASDEHHSVGKPPEASEGGIDVGDTSTTGEHRLKLSLDRAHGKRSDGRNSSIEIARLEALQCVLRQARKSLLREAEYQRYIIASSPPRNRASEEGKTRRLLVSGKIRPLEARPRIGIIERGAIIIKIHERLK